MADRMCCNPPEPTTTVTVEKNERVMHGSNLMAPSVQEKWGGLLRRGELYNASAAHDKLKSLFLTPQSQTIKVAERVMAGLFAWSVTAQRGLARSAATRFVIYST